MSHRESGTEVSSDQGDLSAAPPPVAFDGQPILFPELPYRWKGRTSHYLKDVKVRSFVAQATDTKNRGRRAALSGAFGNDTDAIRRLSGEIKQHTLDHLDLYLEKFIDQAEAAGAKVHFAESAEEANQITVQLAQSHGVRHCVKSKSMVTEEVHLIGALEAAGIQAIETDLGEFIVQLDGDAPSHIVMPMIHKDRRAVARAFERELGSVYTEEPEELTRIARNYLRREFARTDLGVTGGNFLVAETGSVVVCTNEGNGRFCATTPRHQVVMVGIEKLVPDLPSLAPLLKLLARSASGQEITVYTQFLTGPRRTGEVDGPETLDIVLVDAGRSRILSQPTYRAALRCLRCGACQNACPVYRNATGHAYGSVYGGPIGAVITPLLRGIENYPDLPAASSLCGACREACPVDIDLPHMLVSLRRDLLQKKRLPWSKQLLLATFVRAFHSRRRFRFAQSLFRLVCRALSDGDSVRHIPGAGESWTKTRNLPVPARESFRDLWRRRRAKGER